MSVENGSFQNPNADDHSPGRLVIDMEAETGSTAATTPAAKQTNEVVIVGVPHDIDNDAVVQATGAATARRIRKRVNGAVKETTAVILVYNQQAPATVNINQQRFRPRPYVRPAVRCYRCQGWNHRQAGCRNRVRCARCSGDHHTARCQLETTTPLCCANCSGPHSAASPTCPAFHRVQDAWTKVANDKKTYADAIRETRRNNDQQQPPAAAGKATSRGEGGRPTTAARPADIPTAVLKHWAVTKKAPETVDQQTRDTLAQIAVNMAATSTIIEQQTATTASIQEQLQKMEADFDKKLQQGLQKLKEDIMRETTAAMETTLVALQGNIADMMGDNIAAAYHKMAADMETRMQEKQQAIETDYRKRIQDAVNYGERELKTAISNCIDHVGIKTIELDSAIYDKAEKQCRMRRDAARERHRLLDERVTDIEKDYWQQEGDNMEAGRAE